MQQKNSKLTLIVLIALLVAFSVILGTIGWAKFTIGW